ncbi:LamG-like jellyroll fold domain-containing protein [Planctomycetota bacterium]
MKKRISFSFIWILVLGMAPLSLAVDGSWTMKTDMPTARMYLSTSVVNRKIYAIGGASRVEVGISTVEEYDPTTDTWTEKSPMPTPRWGFATGTVNGKIYAIGGAKGHPGSPSKTVEEYDPIADIWTTKADMPTPRWGLSASVVNGKIYAIGGGIPSGVRTVEEYDPVTDIWTQKATIPIGRYGISTCAVNEKIYAIGGVVSYPTITPKVQEYDPMTDTWTTKADMPTARAYPSTCVVNGKIYAMGGETKLNDPSVAIVEVYDTVSDTWAREADMPTARTVFSTSVLKGKIFVMGGSTRGFPYSALAMVEEFDSHTPVFDLNGDQIVDCADMCIMIECWGTDEPFCDIAPPPFGDGIVDIQDVILLAEHMFDDYRAIAQWKLDEIAGDVAYDSVGGHDATLLGEPLWQPTGGRFNGALEFDGIDDYVSTPFVLNPAIGSFSAFAWINSVAPGHVMISQTGGNGGTWLGTNPSEGKLMTGLGGPYFGVLESESVIADGQWHQIGLVYDFNVLKRRLYVDGAQVAEDATFVAPQPSNDDLHLGASKDLDAVSFFSGLIDDVRIYNVVLSAEEIEVLAQ